MTVRHVFFDLDGTLTDSAPGITQCLTHAIVEAGHDAPSNEALRTFIGTPLREIFGALLPSERVEAAVASYIEHFDRTGIHGNAVYPGVREALASLEHAGCRLYVATAKGQAVAERVIDHLELSPFFRAIYGTRPLEGVVSKTDVLRSGLAAESAAGTAAAMVGDRNHDIDAALAMGARALGVGWGYGTHQELARAEQILAAPRDLVATLAGAPGR